MTANVETIIRGAVALDPTITPRMLDLALDALKGVPLVHATTGGKRCEAEELPEIIKRHHAARLLVVKLNTIDHMARMGVLVKVYATGTKRGIGFTRESVSQALKGKAKRHGKRR